MQWQPQVDVSTWQLVGAEALIRWNHPALGTVGPDEFIAIAEQAGLVTRVGTWALREACRAAAEQPDGLAIAVNISPVQLRDGDFVTMVRDTLEDSGLDPHRLEIELTESIFLGDSESVLGRLRALQALGVRIALDDFGTGYSSLAYLRRFPFDTLKIDRTFIRELPLGATQRPSWARCSNSPGPCGCGPSPKAWRRRPSCRTCSVSAASRVQGYLIARPCAFDDVEAMRLSWPESATRARCAVGALSAARPATLNGTFATPDGSAVPFAGESVSACAFAGVEPINGSRKQPTSGRVPALRPHQLCRGRGASRARRPSRPRRAGTHHARSSGALALD